jgi:hypothetical protein
MAQAQSGRDGYVSIVRVEASSEAALAGIRSGVETDRRLALEAKSETAYYADQLITAAPIQVLAYLVAALMATGAAFGSMNIMYGQVSTRTRELSTLRVLGFTGSEVFIALMAEAILFSTLGVALGCGMAYLTIATLLRGGTGTQNLLTFAVKRIQIPAQYLIQSLGFAFEDAFSYLGATSAGKFVTKFLGARALLTLATTAAAIIGPIAIAVALTFAAQGLQDQNAKDLQDNLANALKDGTDEAVAAAEKHLADLEHGARASHNDSWLNIILGQKAAFDKAVEERNRGLEAQANATARNLDGVAATVGQTNGLNYATALLKGIGGGLAEGTKAFNPAIALLKGLGSLGGKELQKLAHEQGLRTAQALAQGYQDGKDAVKTQWSSFLDILKNSESPMKERARLLGELTSKALQKGLHDRDPYVRATAQTTKQVIIDRLEVLIADETTVAPA